MRVKAAFAALATSLRGERQSVDCSSSVAAAPPATIFDSVEARGFLDASNGDERQAVALFEAKREWERTTSGRSMRRIAPFLRSEGYVVCLEGSYDNEGRPVVFSNGMAHGTAEEVMQQVSYAHERVIAQCERLERPLRATTVVNVRNPTFRFPDGPLRSAIEMTDARYPWVGLGRTIFVGFPRPVRYVFESLRVFMSQSFYDSIEFADDAAALADIVPLDGLPADALCGATSDGEFDINAYIRERLRAEAGEAGAPPEADDDDDDDAEQVRSYAGKRQDLRLFDSLR